MVVVVGGVEAVTVDVSVTMVFASFSLIDARGSVEIGIIVAVTVAVVVVVGIAVVVVIVGVIVIVIGNVTVVVTIAGVVMMIVVVVIIVVVIIVVIEVILSHIGVIMLDIVVVIAARVSSVPRTTRALATAGAAGVAYVVATDEPVVAPDERRR